MSFWNYLGLACLLDTLFGRKKQVGTGYAPRCYDPMREAENNARYDELSERINALDRRLDNIDPDSMQYFDIDSEIHDLRDELDDIYEDEEYLDDLEDY